MTCEACDRAQKNPDTGLYQLGCLDCEARALAQGPHAHARHRKTADENGLDGREALRAAMRLLWTDIDTFNRGQVLFWLWVKRLETQKEPTHG